jgi:hypothetical protein
MAHEWRMGVLLKQLARRYFRQLNDGLARESGGEPGKVFIEASPELGDVITLEAGVYTKALRGGIRLEEPEHDIENMFDFPKELYG